MTGAGVLALSLGGQHQTRIAREAGDWLLRHPFDRYRVKVPPKKPDRFFYGAFYCSQAMFQAGGKYWRRWNESMTPAIIAQQQPNGSWSGGQWSGGPLCATAMALLSVEINYNFLPIYQR